MSGRVWGTDDVIMYSTFSSQESKEPKDFHSVSLWRQLADAAVAAGDWEMATQVRGERFIYTYMCILYLNVFN